MASTAEFSSASSAGVNCKAAAPVLSSICAIRDDEVRIHGRLDVLERLVMSGAAAAAVPRFVRKWRPSVDETENSFSLEHYETALRSTPTPPTIGPNPPQRYDLDVRMLPTAILHELECICRNRLGVRPNRRSNAAIRRVVGDSPT